MQLNNWTDKNVQLTFLQVITKFLCNFLKVIKKEFINFVNGACTIFF